MRELVDGYHPAGNGAPLPAFVAALQALGSEAVVFDHARDFFFALASERPHVLVLEDIHWADQASLELLRYLSRRIKNVPLLLIGTYRNDEVTRRDALYTFLPVLIRESSGQLLELRRLPEVDTRELIQQRYCLSPGDEIRLVRHLQEHTEGNPLFMREMLRTLESERILQLEGRGWVLGDPHRRSVPSLIKQVIERRLALVDEATRDLLHLAAVIGQEVPLDLWQSVSGITEDELIEACERTVEAHLFTQAPGGTRIRFTHELLREVLYEEIVLPQRRRLHRRVADAVMTQPSPDPDTVAHHLRQAGDERAADWLIQAGERAQRASAWATAAERYEAALRLLEQTDVDAAQQGWLCYRIARLWRYLDPVRSLRYFDEAEWRSAASEDRILAAFTRFDRSLVDSNLNDHSRALSEMEAGYAPLGVLERSSTPLDPHIASWVADVLPQRVSNGPAEHVDTNVSTRIRQGHSITVLSEAGYFSKVQALGESFLAQCTSGAQPDDLTLASLARAQEGLARAYCAMGRPDDSLRAYAAAQEIWRTLDYHPSLGISILLELAETVRGFRTTQMAERRRLESLADQSYRRAGGVWEIDSARACPLFLPVLLLEGHWEEARKLALATVNQHMGDPHFNSAAARGWLAYYQGDPEMVWELVGTILPDGPASEPGTSKFLRALETQRLAVRLSLDAGDSNTARAWLAAHDHWLDWNGAVLGRADGLLLWAKIYLAEGDAEAARAHAHQALKQASDPEQPLALIAIHRFLGELALEVREFEEADRHLKQSLELAKACAIPFELALTMLALAELEMGRVNRETAQDLLRDARKICTELGARPTLDRIVKLASKLPHRRDSHRHGLSPREVEVLQLLVQGLSDREIGEELFISRHTAMRHVSHILNKLDVDSRTAAAAKAVRDELV